MLPVSANKSAGASCLHDEPPGITSMKIFVFGAPSNKSVRDAIHVGRRIDYIDSSMSVIGDPMANHITQRRLHSSFMG